MLPAVLNLIFMTQKSIKESNMKITKLKYTEDTLNWVSIEFEDGTKGQSSLLDGIRRQYTDDVQAYLDDGGVIEPQYTETELEDQKKSQRVSEAKQELDNTNIAMTVDMFDKLNESEQDAIIEFRDKQLQIIGSGGEATKEPRNINPHLQTVFKKFGIR